MAAYIKEDFIAKALCEEKNGECEEKNQDVPSYHFCCMKQKLQVYVKQLASINSKYGLGYLLSNGCKGVSFNDYSKIIIDKTGTKL